MKRKGVEPCVVPSPPTPKSHIEIEHDILFFIALCWLSAGCHLISPFGSCFLSPSLVVEEEP